MSMTNKTLEDLSDREWDALIKYMFAVAGGKALLLRQRSSAIGKDFVLIRARRPSYKDVDCSE